MEIYNLIIYVMAFIFDIDGTLTAHSWGWASPTGRESINKDTVNTLHRLHSQWNKIIILTWRNSKYEWVTKKWLKDNGIFYDTLFMNPDQNIGSTAYKRAKMQRLMAPGRKIQWWYDDNPGVQKVAEELKIPFTLIR